MGLSPKAISRLHLRPDMEKSAVQMLASQHLLLVSRRRKKTELQTSPTLPPQK
jgi:hypothetical protein